MVGTMIEIPRGALTADEIAQTRNSSASGPTTSRKTTLGMSRDDSGSFLSKYQEMDILKKNPFASIDQTGVGQLMRIAVEKGRSTRPTSNWGSAANTAATPTPSSSCHRTGLTYVSCSPFRVPIARLAAAQAAIEELAQAKTAKKPAKKK